MMQIRMHSSRMHATCPHIEHSACMWGGEVNDLSFLGQWVGEVNDLSFLWGRWSGPGGGAPVKGVVVLSRGRYLPPPQTRSPCDHVTYPMMHLVSPPLPRVEQTDACENITFARFEVQMHVYISEYLV